MKKFTKICLITALIFMITGGAVCAVGAVTGGFRLLNENWYTIDGAYGGHWARLADGVSYGIDHRWEEGWYDDWREDWGEDWDEDWDDDIEKTLDDAWDRTLDEVWDDYDEHNTDYEQDGSQHSSTGIDKSVSNEGYEDLGLTSAEISNLDIAIGGAEFYVKQSETDTFGIEKEGTGTVDLYQNGSTLYIEGVKHRAVNGENTKLYLYIPKDKVFQTMDLAIGGGVAKLGDIRADEVDMEIGGGILSADSITGHIVSVDAGAGDVNLNGVVTDELDVGIGSGKADIRADVTYEISLECGVGKANLSLAGSEQDYNYSVECVAGSIQVGSHNFSAIAGEKYVDNKAAGNCSLECGLGSITVGFDS